MEFHENVKAFRRDVLNFKQFHLANLLGISQSCLSNYENGIRSYPQDILEKIGNLAGIPFPDFITLTYPYKNRKRASASEQLLMAKEAQQYLAAGFIEKHLHLFETEADVRDFILLLSQLPKSKRTKLIVDWKKQIVKELQKE